MKFAEQLEYNAYGPWKPYYLAYSELKDTLRTLRKKQPLFPHVPPLSLEQNLQSTSGKKQESKFFGDIEEGEIIDSSEPDRAESCEEKHRDESYVVHRGEGRRLQRRERGGERESMRRTASQAALEATGLDRSASSRVLMEMGKDVGDDEAGNETKSDESDQNDKHDDDDDDDDDDDESAETETVRLLDIGQHGDEYGTAWTPEWHASAGEGFKRRGRDLEEGRGTIGGRRHSRAISFDEAERAFSTRLEVEADKVDKFFQRMVQELKFTASKLYRYACLVKRVFILYRANIPIKVEEFSEEERKLYRTLQDYDANTLFELFHALEDKYVETYKEVDELINFCELNRTGFDKILKKHDKVTELNIRADFMSKLNRTRSFTATNQVEELREKLIVDYAALFCDNNRHRAMRKFQEATRKLVVWERNTIWREMLREERKVTALHAKGKDTFSDAVNLYAVCLAVLVFLVILCIPQTITILVQPKSGYSKETLGAAHRCLAMLVAVCILWASGGLELFVTSLLVIPASVLLHCFLDGNGYPLNPPDAAKQVFATTGSSTLMLIISVYATHAALSKYEVDKVVATKILSKVRQPEVVLLVLMVLAVVLSMFVSNVATPVLLNSVVLPVFHSLPITARPLIRCMLLGIAIASNVGGMASTIASPQNAVAVGQLTSLHEIGFLQWLIAALPVCIIILIISHRLLIVMFRPGDYELQPVKEHEIRFRWQHYIVISVTALTVFLWSIPNSSTLFGSQGLVAMLPVVVFFGTGLLRKEDFDNLPWHVIYLVAGGIALGAAVQSSNLLSIIADYLMAHLTQSSVWMTYSVFVIFVAIVASAVSHTVSAIIVLPIVAEVGASLGHPRLLVMGCALACSSAMCLPISSFPNISAVSIRDELGSPYLETSELMRVGIIMTIVSVAVIMTSGYFLMSFIGF